jgi:hypothetical protein
MSELITQHCVLLEQWKEDNELCQDRDDILNDLRTELIRLQSTDVDSFRQEMNKVTSLLCCNILNLNESILTFFLDYFIHLFKQWHESTYFNDKNNLNTLENLETIFIDRSDSLMNNLLIKEFTQCLYTMARIGKNMFTDQNIVVITRMLNTYTKIKSNYGYQFMDVSEFDDCVIKCLCAPFTTEVFGEFKSSVKSQERTLTENFVFNGLFYYAEFMNREQLQEKSFELRKHLLGSISDLLDTFLISSEEWSESAIKFLTDITIFFLYSVYMTVPNDICLDKQIHICDTAIRILLIPTFRSMKFNNNCVQYIYMGTLNDKILDYLKSQKLTETMFKISNLYKTESEIQFNIYRILSAIMTEEDIKRLDDPGAIAKIFLEQLDEKKDLPGWETRIRNLLTTLKSNYFN